MNTSVVKNDEGVAADNSDDELASKAMPTGPRNPIDDADGDEAAMMRCERGATLGADCEEQYASVSQ